MRIDWRRVFGCLGFVVLCLLVDVICAYGAWSLGCWAVSFL